MKEPGIYECSACGEVLEVRVPDRWSEVCPVCEEGTLAKVPVTIVGFVGECDGGCCACCES